MHNLFHNRWIINDKLLLGIPTCVEYDQFRNGLKKKRNLPNLIYLGCREETIKYSLTLIINWNMMGLHNPE